MAARSPGNREPNRDRLHCVPSDRGAETRDLISEIRYAPPSFHAPFLRMLRRGGRIAPSAPIKMPYSVSRSRLVGETGAAPGTAASQHLAAICGSHALTEPVLLGALTLLGLIGTNHVGTPPVLFSAASFIRPPQRLRHGSGTAVVKENNFTPFWYMAQNVLYPIIKGNVNTIFARLFSFSLQPAFLHHIWCFCLKCHLLDQYIFIKVYRLKALPQGPFFDIIIKLQTEENEEDTTMNVPADIWAKVLSLMENDMTATTINTWFDDARAVALEENRFILHTPSNFKRDIILSRYLPAVQKALHELFSADFEITVLGEGELENYSKTEDTSFLPGTEEYTFERFVVGSSNKFAHAAAVSVAENPAKSYNPLFIYGESGLGKTHLLYAIAHRIHHDHPDYRVLYIKGDSFTNELIQAIREGRNQEFREKYRFADVFLMDDVQFIAGKESSQEEMFHTFNSLYEAGRQIVFTADRPPKEMLRLDDRLKTRFEWGLPVDIQPPDYETRVAIIKNKAIRRGMNLPDPVLQYIAENITSNVRQIEGTVNKILAFQELMGDSVDVDTVIRAMRDMLKDKADFLPSSDVIIEEVSQFYGIEADAIRGQGRTKDTALARQIAMYQIRRITTLSLKEIGREFDNRDHTTVMHSIERIEKLIKTNPEIAEVIKDINANINARYE